MDGKGYSKLFAFSNNSEAFSVDLFRGGFNLDDFLSALCREAAAEKEEGTSIESSLHPLNKTTATKNKIIKLLEDFRKTESRLRKLHQNVTEQLHEAQSQLEAEQEQYKGVVEVIDRQFVDLRRDFSVVDTKIANFGQIGARVGELLKRSFERQTRAENALELIKYLEDFSRMKGKGDFSSLPEIFTDDGCLPQAAEVAQKLLRLTSELLSAKARLNENSTATPEMGSLEYSIQALQEYCNHLENRVVSRFDFCTNVKDLQGMKECADIMAKLDKEMILVQRYICSRPMFIDLKEVQRNQSSSMAMMDLQTMYREILTTVKHEAQVVESVFPSSHRAMELFLQRVLEQRVRSALDVILVEPEDGAEPEEIRDFIRLVAQVYEKTHTLAINLERVTADHLDLIELCDGLVSEYISNYPQIELDWLAQMKRKQDSLSPEGALDVNAIMIFIEWNKEAVQRCKALSSQSLVAPRVRQLFHSSTYYEANLGCLLEQAARHIMKGLRISFEQHESNSAALISSNTIPDLSNKAISTAAQNLVDHGIGHTFLAVSQATQMIKHLQMHYKTNIEGYVASSVTESAACNSGLLTLIRAIEEKVLEGLDNGLRLFFGQIERILSAEQKKNEYRPNAGTMMVFDRPTVACQLVSTLLDAMRVSASRNIKQPNLGAFLEEAGYEASACLSFHITRFTFSPAGALRLKRDMAAYIDTIREFESAETLSQFETLQQLVNVFIVAPESLVGLVDGSLRMSHKDALKYVQLREDFKTARVDGHSLAQLFASEMNEFD